MADKTPTTPPAAQATPKPVAKSVGSRFVTKQQAIEQKVTFTGEFHPLIQGLDVINKKQEENNKKLEQSAEVMKRLVAVAGDEANVFVTQTKLLQQLVDMQADRGHLTKKATEYEKEFAATTTAIVGDSKDIVDTFSQQVGKLKDIDTTEKFALVNLTKTLKLDKQRVDAIRHMLGLRKDGRKLDAAITKELLKQAGYDEEDAEHVYRRLAGLDATIRSEVILCQLDAEAVARGEVQLDQKRKAGKLQESINVIIGEGAKAQTVALEGEKSTWDKIFSGMSKWTKRISLGVIAVGATEALLKTDVAAKIISAHLGTANDVTDDLVAGTVELSKEFGKSVSEVITLQTQMVKLGMTGEEVAGYSKDMLARQTLFGLSIESQVTTLRAFTKQYGMTLPKANELYWDIIKTGATLREWSVAEFVEEMDHVRERSRGLNVDFHKIMAVYSTLSNIKVSKNMEFFGSLSKDTKKDLSKLTTETWDMSYATAAIIAKGRGLKNLYSDPLEAITSIKYSMLDLGKKGFNPVSEAGENLKGLFRGIEQMVSGVNAGGKKLGKSSLTEAVKVSLTGLDTGLQPDTIKELSVKFADLMSSKGNAGVEANLDTMVKMFVDASKKDQKYAQSTEDLVKSSEETAWESKSIAGDVEYIGTLTNIGVLALLKRGDEAAKEYDGARKSLKDIYVGGNTQVLESRKLGVMITKLGRETPLKGASEDTLRDMGVHIENMDDDSEDQLKQFEKFGQLSHKAFLNEATMRDFPDLLTLLKEPPVTPMGAVPGTPGSGLVTNITASEQAPGSKTIIKVDVTHTTPAGIADTQAIEAITQFGAIQSSRERKAF